MRRTGIYGSLGDAEDSGGNQAFPPAPRNRSHKMLKLKSISKVYRTTEVETRAPDGRVVAETLLAA
jgi:hypothetical protein